jgi:hypothetical protein
MSVLVLVTAGGCGIGGGSSDPAGPTLTPDPDEASDPGDQPRPAES